MSNLLQKIEHDFYQTVLELKINTMEKLLLASSKFGVIRKFITEKFHPCIMAHSVLQSGNLIEKHYSSMDSKGVVSQIIEDLSEYIELVKRGDKKQFYSFAAVFEKEVAETEAEFETKLWKLLNELHAQDDCAWDKNVSHDACDKNFSFSLVGRAFYIIGLHPASSRKARRCPKVTVIFNLHSQFEKLREMGVYERTRDRIRKRDAKLQGNINPMLRDFGNDSEAKQYSGKATDENWKCPFHFIMKKIG